jgi:hypothetical protein
MEIVVPPPAAVRCFLFGLPAGIGLLALLLRGKPVVHRILMFVVVAAACLGISWFALRPMRFAWDESGIRDATFGEERRMAWSEIRSVEVVRCYNRTDFRPIRRTSGTAYSGWRSGEFEVASGATLRVFLEPEVADAVVLRTADSTYLYAPRSFESFLEVVKRHTRALPAS